MKRKVSFTVEGNHRSVNHAVWIETTNFAHLHMANQIASYRQFSKLESHARAGVVSSILTESRIMKASVLNNI